MSTDRLGRKGAAGSLPPRAVSKRLQLPLKVSAGIISCFCGDGKACDAVSDFRPVAARLLNTGTSGSFMLPMGQMILAGLPGNLSPHRGWTSGELLSGCGPVACSCDYQVLLLRSMGQAPAGVWTL